MLRDYLKVEKEDQLVEQQSRHDNSQHYSFGDRMGYFK